MEHGADPNIPSISGSTPLHFIIKNFDKAISDSPSIIKLLLKYDAKLDIVDDCNQTVFDIVEDNSDTVVKKSTRKTRVITKRKKLLVKRAKLNKHITFRKYMNKHNRPN